MRSTDVLVLGGGPAGCTAAVLLASWGHAVRLITRPPGEARLAESLPPSCYKLFDTVDISEAIARAGFIRSTGNTVWWGSPHPRVEYFADGARGWQVDALVLESALLERAAAAGVTIERRVIGGFEGEGGAFQIDCTGRSGLLAKKKNLREYEDGPRTIALVASWKRDAPWPVPDDSHTLIESYETGWAWSVPVLPGLRHVAMMVDPQRSGLGRGRGARDIYLAEIQKTRVFRELTATATFADGPWGWDASPYRSRAYAGDDWLLAGDAGSFIDPLSSAGVKKAIASGWLAAIATHTALVNPPMKDAALAFFSQRETEIEQHYAKVARHFIADAATGHTHSFWSDRADDDFSAAAVPKGGSTTEAFERLRAADSVSFRRDPDVRIEAKPGVQGNLIVLEPRIVSEDWPSGIRHIRSVDLVLMLELAPAASQVPDLFEMYCRQRGTVPLPDFLYALSTAICEGWLVSE